MVYFSSKEEPIITVCKEIQITGTGALTVNVFQVFGNIRVINQYAEITSVTTLTNATNVYATLYDGTNTVNLTADGAILSGLPVGSLFTKDKIASEIYSVSDASQCQINETLVDKKTGYPFTVTQKSGTDTFIRFHLTTTDAPVDFTIHLHFEWEPVDGGYLELLV